MVLRFYERSEPSPSAHFSLDRSESRRTYVLFNDNFTSTLNPEDVWPYVKDILGDTARDTDDGRLRRTPPRADPRYGSLFAEDLTVRVPPRELFVEGLKLTGLEVKPIDGVADWYGMEFDVTFRNRPYPLVKDDRLVKKSVDFPDEGGVQKRLYYYEEWLRYCYHVSEARDSYVRATQGSSMRFRAPALPKVNNAVFTGVPSIPLRDSTVTVRWYGVPQRYVDSPNSYLTRYRSFINYRDWWRWPAASLLYIGYKLARVYTPPAFEAADAEQEVFPGTFTADKLVDLELTFIHTVRENADPTVPAPTNPNWLQAGHNLLPHFLTRRFYWATVAPTGADTNDQTKWAPSYQSVCFEVLFQDPDAGNLIPAPA